MVSTVSLEKPRTAHELAAMLREAAATGKAVTPVGGGRAAGMGGLLERSDVELHTTLLDRVIEHSPADMVVTVEAGITLEALQSELAQHRQFLPLDPFNSPGHTVGGQLASGWTGPLRLRYGSPRDFLIGIRVALPDGRLASAGGRVVKNVSGYDMMKLHIGALGSLGVIVAASFKLFPTPLHDVTVTSSGGWDDTDRVLAMPLGPSAVELFDDGRVYARFLGSRDAVSRVVADLGWQEADGKWWTEHARALPMTRISTPREKLREVLEGRTGWWASPGAGIAHWSCDSPGELVEARKKAETAGGSLVLMAAPDEVKRTVHAWGTAPATLDVMRKLKDAFDPGHVLNPGRFVV